MILMQGKGVSRGVASGPVCIFRHVNAEVRRMEGLDPEAERARILQAQETSMEQLNALAEKAREEAGDEAALLFETHAMFVEDEDYVQCMQDVLEEENCNAEYAVQEAGKQFSAMLATMEDPYLRDRAADIL